MPATRIVLAGGTGLLGGLLSHALVARGHDVVVLTRRPSATSGTPRLTGETPVPQDSGETPVPRGHGRVRLVGWTPDGTAGAWVAEVDGAVAVVNLAGESLAARRWSPAQKQRLRDSRLDATRSLVAAIAGAGHPPGVFVSASAIGYYGDRHDEVLTEASTPGADFLAELCTEWERIAGQAAGPETRVVLIRSGIVLDAVGGALPRMLTAFRLFAGGPLGSGRQYMSWIHRKDWAALVLWATDNAAVRGPINATAPVPVTNADFARALGAALGRPAWLPAPSLALRLLLGEMGEALVLGGQRVIPERARALGFQFEFEQVEAALKDVLTPQPRSKPSPPRG
jgi:hypothetical protein